MNVILLYNISYAGKSILAVKIQYQNINNRAPKTQSGLL